jgi:Ala-tRNA(Pro) deacylase
MATSCVRFTACPELLELPELPELNTENRLYADLNARNIAFEVAEHEAVFTVEEGARLHDELPGAHSKNLFLKDQDGLYWLVTVPAEIRVALKALPPVIGSRRLSFGNGDDMERLLGVTPGSVTPLAAFNDAAGAVRVVIDRRLAEADRVWVHPLRNTASLAISGADLVTALAAWGHAPLIVDVPHLEAAP